MAAGKTTPFTKAPRFYAFRNWQSLQAYYCPECRGDFRLLDDGTNVCKSCGLELVTEFEWNRRQQLQISVGADHTRSECHGS